MECGVVQVAAMGQELPRTVPLTQMCRVFWGAPQGPMSGLRVGFPEVVMMVSPISIIVGWKVTSNYLEPHCFSGKIIVNSNVFSQPAL